MRLPRFRYLIGGLSLVFAALLWVWLAEDPAEGRIFGLFRLRVFVLLVVISYLAVWAAHMSFSSERLSSSMGKFLLTTTALGFTLGLLELPALIGIVDYRRIVPLPDSALLTRLKPWQNPGNRLDRELLHVHHPGQEIKGETVGDLVHWLQISTERRYQVNIKYDSHGFRNDHEIERAPVIVVGDSFAEGVLVDAMDLVSTRLARSLDLDVANLGQSGYGPQQELIVLQRYGLKLEPRLVLWLFFEGNDLRDVPRYDQLRSVWDEEMLRHKTVRRRLLSRSVLQLLAALTGPSAPREEMKARRRSCIMRDPVTDENALLYFAYDGKSLSEENLTSLQKTKEILQEADRLSGDNGARLMLVYVPTKFRVYDGECEYPEESALRTWRVNDLPQRMAAWAVEHGIPFVDLTESLKKYAAGGEMVYLQDDGHWNARGHEIAAEAILDAIERTGLRATLR